MSIIGEDNVANIWICQHSDEFSSGKVRGKKFKISKSYMTSANCAWRPIGDQDGSDRAHALRLEASIRRIFSKHLQAAMEEIQVKINEPA